VTELQRYEASLERTLSRLGRDLDRAQALRRQRLADAHAAEMAELEAEGRALAMRRKMEAEMPEADFAKRTQPPAAADDPFDMSRFTIPRLEAELAKRTQPGGAVHPPSP
jgi:hypothetical protein